MQNAVSDLGLHSLQYIQQYVRHINVEGTISNFRTSVVRSGIPVLRVNTECMCLHEDVMVKHLLQ